MAVKQFNPQPTGNEAMDRNFKELKDIIAALIQADINKQKEIDSLKK